MVKTRNFASIAEAVTHYFLQGYKTTAMTSTGRVMSNGNVDVYIRKTGLLFAIADEVTFNDEGLTDAEANDILEGAAYDVERLTA